MTLGDRIEATAARLRAACDAQGVFITGDDRISEASAAALLGYAAGSFKNMRHLGSGPAFYNRPLAGSRVSYRLEALAAWVEEAREDPFF